MLEAQARQELESDGCPPCYPFCLDVPIREPPEEYRDFINYWQSFASTDDVVLCAQRSDWRTFRQSQQRLRHHYRNKSFGIFLGEVRERRRTHGLNANVHLLLDTEKQSRQQNWIEFQDYHLNLHERQEKKRDGLQQELNNLQKEAGDTDREDSEYLARQERAIYQRLEYAERTLQWHEIMLCWIEKCRLTMTSSSTLEQMPKRREMKPRRAKEKALTHIFSQRVVKANRLATTGTKSRSKTLCKGDGRIRDRAGPQRRSTAQQPFSTFRSIRTRIQRVSREPVR